VKINQQETKLKLNMILTRRLRILFVRRTTTCDRYVEG